MNQRLISREELAQMLGLSRRTVESPNFVKLGIPAIRVGRLVRFDPRDVEAFLARQRGADLQRAA